MVKMPCLFNEQMLSVVLCLKHAVVYHFETYQHKSMYFSENVKANVRMG